MFEGKNPLLSDIRATVKINLLFCNHTVVKREQTTSFPGRFPCNLRWVDGGGGGGGGEDPGIRWSHPQDKSSEGG